MATKYERTLDDFHTRALAKFGGELHTGSHEPPNGECKACFHELDNWLHDREWNDAVVGKPDFIRLNDIRGINPRVRYAHMLPIMAAYEQWGKWSDSRRHQVAKRLVILGVNRILAGITDLPDGLREQCRKARTIDQASEAAYKAKSYDTRFVAADFYSAYVSLPSVMPSIDNIVFAARSATFHAGNLDSPVPGDFNIATAEQTFITACGVFLDATKVSGPRKVEV